MTLSDRSLGWLRGLDRKSATPDNWDRNGRPHPHWDERTESPHAGHVRGDLVESALALGLMARRTPAWTERYETILDRLIGRHLRWYAGADGQGEIDPEPIRGHYRDDGTALVPAEANLAYKASLLLLLGIRAAINPHGPWDQPFPVFGDGGEDRRWTYTELATDLADQWAAYPDGPPSKNTKAWPEQLAMAGLALLLADRQHGSSHHQRVVAPWWERARREDFGLDEAEGLTVTGDRDALPGPVQPAPTATLLTTACWIAAYAEHDARRLFDAAVAASGLDQMVGDGPEAARQAGFALLLAKHWELTELSTALSRSIEQRYEPVFEPVEGTFHFGLGLGEDAPRGRPNAVLAAAEACGAGLWTHLAAPPTVLGPQIVDVDFPRLALSRAQWSRDCLVLRLVAAEESRTVFSTFRLVGAEPRIWCVAGVDGVSTDVTSREVIVRVPLRSGELEFAPGSY